MGHCLHQGRHVADGDRHVPAGQQLVQAAAGRVSPLLLASRQAVRLTRQSFVRTDLDRYVWGPAAATNVSNELRAANLGELHVPCGRANLYPPSQSGCGSSGG